MNSPSGAQIGTRSNAMLNEPCTELGVLLCEIPLRYDFRLYRLFRILFIFSDIKKGKHITVLTSARRLLERSQTQSSIGGSMFQEAMDHIHSAS